MKQLLESLDPTVFTPELVDKIELVFESAVEAKVSQINEQSEKYSSFLQEEYTNKIKTIEEEFEAKADEYSKYVQEEFEAKADEYSKYVQEHFETKAEEYAQYIQEEYMSTLDSYMDKVVENFVEENKIVIEESVKQAKVDALLEGFDSLLIAGAVSLADITEARSEKQIDESVDTTIAELKAEVSKLIKENSALKADNTKAIKEGIYSSITESMTLAQKDAFARVAKSIKFEDEVSYKDSLGKLQESIVSLSQISDNNDANKGSSQELNESDVKSKYKRFI